MHRPWVLAPAVILGILVTQVGAPDPVTRSDEQVRLAAALAAVEQQVDRWGCALPHRARTERPADPPALAFTAPATPTRSGQVDALTSSTPIPGFGAGPGQNPRGTLTGSLAGAQAVDTYSFTLHAGEVFAATVRGAGGQLEVRDPAGTLVEGSAVDRSGIYPASSPLLGGGNATVDHVAGTTGEYTLTVRRAPAKPTPPAGAPASGAAPSASSGTAPGGAAPGAGAPGGAAPGASAPPSGGAPGTGAPGAGAPGGDAAPAGTAPERTAAPAPVATPRPVQPAPGQPATPTPVAAPAALPTTTPAAAPAPAPSTAPAAVPADQGVRILPDTAVGEGAEPPVAATHPVAPAVPAAAVTPAPATPAPATSALAAAAPAPATPAPATTPATDAYVADVGIFRPAQPVAQHIVLEFGGATVDVRRFGMEPANPAAKLSPMSAFLAGWGLTAADEPALIARVTDTVRANLQAATGGGGVDVTAAPEAGKSPFGRPGVSRVVIGGTAQEAGIATVGISESVDPGNFAREETALVLLDRLSGPATQAVSLGHYLDGQHDKAVRIEFIGRALGNIVSHEVGHFLGSWHTDADSGKHDLMAPGDIIGAFGFGGDSRGGTADDLHTRFGQDSFAPSEGFTGAEDTRTRTVVGLSDKPAANPG